MIDYDIWFSIVKLSYKIKLNLLKNFKSTEELRVKSMKGNFFNADIQKALEKAWDEENINKLKDIISKKDIKVINFNDKLYPEKLKNYDDVPSILFYKGDINKLNNSYSISIVGSRKCTNYGVDVTRLISRELSANNINIVSGMAKGIDSYAHREAINNGGYTCGVLGCGIDVIYPKENANLFSELSKKGCIISEFIPTTEPYAFNFPIRNRIISGLSDIVIVVEAGIKSGSLITANFALDQGKDVMVVPGNVFSDQSKGCNKLLKEGAYPLTKVEDIFEILGVNFNKKEQLKQKVLKGLEKKIYNTISNEPIHIDDIIKITNIDIKQLYEVLFELQLKDEIMCLAGNYYVKANNII